MEKNITLVNDDDDDDALVGIIMLLRWIGASMTPWTVICAFNYLTMIMTVKWV